MPSDVEQYTILEKNLDALKSKDFNLYQKVKSTPLSGRFVLDDAQNGSKTIVFVDNGSKKYLHSRYDPEKEAERFVKSYDFTKRLEVFVFGIGLGYHIDLLLEERLESINVLEADLSLFRLLLSARDITSWIMDERITFVVGATAIEAMNIINKKNQPRVLWRPLLMFYEPITRLFPEKFSQLKTVVEDDIMYSSTMATTVLVVSFKTMENSFRNLPYLVKCPGVEGWLSAFKDRPIFCVSPGPSLKTAIDVLKKAKGKAPIVAVDTALKPLLKNGVKPDFVIGMDFTPENKRHYEGVSEEDMKDIILIADSDMYSEIFPMWKGPMFTTYYNHYLQGYFHFKSNMVKGPTTSHMAFLFAFYMGGDPIILIGQDLSYPDIDEAYVPGVSYQRKLTIVKDRAGNELLLKINSDDPTKKSLTFLERVEAVDGGEVITEPIFLTFGITFERMIDSLRVNVIDAKTRGMKIKGAVNMPPDEAYERFCKGLQPDMDIMGRAEVFARYSVADIDMKGISKKMRKIIRRYNGLNKDVKKAFGTIEQIYKKGRRKNVWQEQDLLKVNTIIDKLFEDYEEEIGFCQLLAGMVTLLVKKYLTFTEDVSHKDRFETILAFWEGIMKASKDVLDLYRDSLKLYKKEGLI